MSILPQGAAGALAGIGRPMSAALLPGSCVLCGADSGAAALCPPCLGDLPSLPAARCPQCAEATTHGERCGRCLAHPPAFDGTLALYRYAFPLDRLVHALKYGHQLALARCFGQALAAALPAEPFDRVVPLPLHPERLRERGFNQAGEIARCLARAARRGSDPDCLERLRATPPQASLPLAERAANVRRAFGCRRDLTDESILLVDDVMTSGATLDEAARTLKLHGAATVWVAVIGRALRSG